MLSKSLSTSVKRARLHEALGPLAEFAQALYPLLVAHADDFGRQSGDSFTVKHQIDPTSPRTLVEFDEALDGMANVGLLVRYDNKGTQVLSITDFENHQTGLHKRTESRFPPPPPAELPGNFPEIPGNSGSRARAELKGTEGKGTESKYALRAHPRPVEKPKVTVLAAMIRADILPRGFVDEGDAIEAAKHRAAKLHIPYSSSTICRALASARGQLAKRGQA